MMQKNHNATYYLAELSQLLVQTVVTDEAGILLTLDEGADRAVDFILKVISAGGKTMVMGNGGSAAIASHLHNDLCKAVGVRSLAFNEQSLMTALANDHGYGCVYERPMIMWAEKNDLLFGISSSGKSDNILRGTRVAAEKGCSIITFSGFEPDNPLRRMGNLNFYVNSHSYGLVEVAHSALSHLLTDMAMSRNHHC